MNGTQSHQAKRLEPLTEGTRHIIKRLTFKEYMFNGVILATHNTFNTISYPKAFQFLVGDYSSVQKFKMKLP